MPSGTQLRHTDLLERGVDTLRQVAAEVARRAGMPFEAPRTRFLRRHKQADRIARLRADAAQEGASLENEQTLIDGHIHRAIHSHAVCVHVREVEHAEEPGVLRVLVAIELEVQFAACVIAQMLIHEVDYLPPDALFEVGLDPVCVREQRMPVDAEAGERAVLAKQLEPSVSVRLWVSRALDHVHTNSIADVGGVGSPERPVVSTGKHLPSTQASSPGKPSCS